jgi:hypothetical protein
MAKEGVVYLDPEIAGEGESANNWAPGAWTNAPATEDEYQPDIEPPHVNDYAAFKKHKHYRQYFRPYRYHPFPAFLYHPTLGEKIVKTKEEVFALGPEWSPIPIKPRVDMTGKSLPVKNDTQRLTEALVAGMAGKKDAGDPATIAAIVAAVVGAMQQPQQAFAERTVPQTAAGSLVDPPVEIAKEPERAVLTPDNHVSSETERTALLELADKEGIKVDGRWSNERLKKELGLD